MPRRKAVDTGDVMTDLDGPDVPTAVLHQRAAGHVRALKAEVARMEGQIGSLRIGETAPFPSESRSILIGWSRRLAEKTGHVQAAVGELIAAVGRE